MEFETVAFFDYDIRSTVIDGVRMYLVSDLLSQYNEKHGTNKRFTHYLDNKQTKDLLLKKLEHTGSRNSGLQCQLVGNEERWDIEKQLRCCIRNLWSC